ncbi:hypothetical protein TNCV_1587781 [Trichonephila clavipes]|uniref:Uncharacterized protein n=1 Tax=Trichonephila clavipes TaxID=2585209 RepID=A0A8X6UUW5_TRICX|nr:hypothetical protein TNCV_1587781 [Trichonephila clavipes]
MSTGWAYLVGRWPVRPSLWVRSRPQSIDSLTVFMLYGYAACKRSLKCLFGLGALGKIKFLQVWFRIFRTQVPPSGEETGLQNYVHCSNEYLTIWCCSKKLPAPG